MENAILQTVSNVLVIKMGKNIALSFISIYTQPSFDIKKPLIYYKIRKVDTDKF